MLCTYTYVVKVYTIMNTEYVPFHETDLSLDTSLSVNGRIFVLPTDFSGRVVSLCMYV